MSEIFEQFTIPNLDEEDQEIAQQSSVPRVSDVPRETSRGFTGEVSPPSLRSNSSRSRGSGLQEETKDHNNLIDKKIIVNVKVNVNSK